MATARSVRPQLSLATCTGLFVALVIPFLSYAAGRMVFGAEQSTVRVAFGVLIHWVNFAVLIAVVVLFEHQPLGSIGLQSMRWWTIPAGIVGGAAITLSSGVLVNVFKLNSDVSFATYLQSLPFIIRLVLVVTAGIFEETLYRGYAIERLTMIFGGKWTAAAFAVALFTLAHLPAVGLAHLLPVGIVSVLVTLLYLWRRDLTLNIVAHITIDAIGLLVVPMSAGGAR